MLGPTLRSLTGRWNASLAAKRRRALESHYLWLSSLYLVPLATGDDGFALKKEKHMMKVKLLIYNIEFMFSYYFCLLFKYCFCLLVRQSFFFCPEERRLKATLNKISFVRGPQGEWGPGSARARASRAPNGSFYLQTPFTLRTRFRGNLVTCRTLR